MRPAAGRGVVPVLCQQSATLRIESSRMKPPFMNSITLHTYLHYYIRLVVCLLQLLLLC